MPGRSKLNLNLAKVTDCVGEVTAAAQILLGTEKKLRDMEIKRKARLGLI